MKIDLQIDDGKSGDWEISTFRVTDDDLMVHNLRAAFKPGCRTIQSGTYKKLTYHGEIVMSNVNAEIRDHLSFIRRAKLSENILINGLGLGVALTEILKSDEVKSVTIIEISEDVINLVAPFFSHDKRVTIINADAFTWNPPKGVRYDVVWHDIWNHICADNLPEMTRLHRKYGRRTGWQGSWCKDLCKRLR